MSTPTTPAPSPKETAKAALEKLTPQRRKFVLAYCELFNATKAALKAGYSKKTARTQASQLLTILDIKAAVRAVMATASMDPEEIAARWTLLARAGLDDFYSKVEYEETTKVPQSLAVNIAEMKRAVDFEEKVHARLHMVSPEDGVKHFTRQLNRKNDIIRLEVEMEENPEAFRLVDGPKVKKHRMEFDLVKAADLGLLDLVKSISYGEFGPKLELRSPDAALDNLAKWQGMLTTKVDITSGGEPLPSPAILGALSAEQARAILDARRNLRKEGATGE